VLQPAIQILISLYCVFIKDGLLTFSYSLLNSPQDKQHGLPLQGL
jgi:hypothetical protein